MPTGSEHLVLVACDELAGHSHGFVLDSDIARKTGMALGTVQDCLRGLDREGYVDLVPLERGDLRASVTPKGRQELEKDAGIVRTPIKSPDIKGQVKVVPRGLRSFDEHDADFFPELLPGPRRADGLPESVHFWKVRIEEVDPDKTFRVGLIYGPSGCGKSSLVKAGILPKLDLHVQKICVEASTDQTEVHLVREIRKLCPDLPPNLGLEESLAGLSEGRGLAPGTKILIVLDQFEQWLSTWRGEEESCLVAALRQCDGGHVQALVMVRDDFWMSVNRFEKQLGVEFRRTQNSYGIDLFDPIHAEKVLADFGVGFGLLPEDQGAISNDQEKFLAQAVGGLVENGKITPVRLSLFTWMVRGKPWTQSTLKEIGGAEGVGVKFLEETFGSPAEPKYRLHQKAAQAVLKALLPEGVTRIRGEAKSYSELLSTSGYAHRPEDFDELCRILDEEVRLITPTAPEQPSGSYRGKSATLDERYYQLTHDYLVPSIREWLTRNQRETRKGRAELRLADRSSLWNLKPENRFLPSPLEWANIRMLTKKREWTSPQRKMMKRATMINGMRLSCFGAVVIFLILILMTVYAGGLKDQLLVADIDKVPEIVHRLRFFRLWTDPALRRVLEDVPVDSARNLRARIALLPADTSQLPFLEGQLY